MRQQLGTADSVRQDVAPKTPTAYKSEFGQFMTPAPVARFMAQMFPAPSDRFCRLLDAGAGVGALSCAFLDRWVEGQFQFDQVETTAYERDDVLREHLARHLAGYTRASVNVVGGDYIHLATGDRLLTGDYTHVILNPPYKKINGKSTHRQALRSVGIETVNLYSAFVALALAQTAPGGQLVAIIPRSFCNGPYYRAFRDFVFARSAIRHIHLFDSRAKAFQEDGVLQENIIIRLERDGVQGDVTVTVSTDEGFEMLASGQYPFERIVMPGDDARFIHIPTSSEKQALETSSAICHSLSDLGITVSTGPVIEHRFRAHLVDSPAVGCAPLLFPAHVKPAGLSWPIEGFRKPNAIIVNGETRRWLLPGGFYCAVKRFSSKEERRRVVAGVIDPAHLGGSDVFGVENHLNYFHIDKGPLPEAIARGLSVFLNTSAVDALFRRFNGHTQVNATDLRSLRYPGRDVLVQLGEWAKSVGDVSQAEIDARFDEVILAGTVAPPCR